MFLAASWVGWTESLQSFTGMSFFLMTDSANDVVIYWKLHFCRICSLDHEAGIIALMGGCWHSRLNTTGTEVCLAYNNPLVWPWCSGTWGVTAILQNYLVHTCIFRLDLFTLWKYKRLRSLSGSLTAWGLVHCRLRHWILAYASQTFWKGCAVYVTNKRSTILRRRRSNFLPASKSNGNRCWKPNGKHNSNNGRLRGRSLCGNDSLWPERSLDKKKLTVSLMRQCVVRRHINSAAETSPPAWGARNFHGNRSHDSVINVICLVASVQQWMVNVALSTSRTFLSIFIMVEKQRKL